MAIDIAATYRRIRNGKSFAIGLLAFCLIWIVWNATPGLPHFDDNDDGRLVTWLSIEASIGLSIYGAITEARDKQAEQRDRQHDEILRHLRDLLEAQAVTMRAVHDYLVATHPTPLARSGVESSNVAEGKKNA